MTTPPPTRPGPSRPDPSDPGPLPGPPLQVRGPGDLLVALPAVIGFTPTRSLVLVCLRGPGGRRLGLVARVDLPPTHAAHAVAEQLATAAAGDGSRSAVLVVLDDRPGGHPLAVDAVADALDEVGVDLTAVLRVDRLALGGCWWGDDLDGSGPADGVLTDPRLSAVNVAQVVAGRVLHADRRGVESAVAPDPGAGARTGAVAFAVARARGARTRAGSAGAAAGLAVVVDAVTRPPDGPAPAEDELAVLAAVLDDPVVRDACVALAATEHAAAAEQLWGYLTRGLPAPWRAVPATLLAVSAYARGEGPLAGIAVDAALEADPGQRLAGMLRTALDHAMPPSLAREVVESSRAGAVRLGLAG